MLGGENMTDKEKNYLLDMFYNNLNHSEIDYYNYLYKINSRVDDYTLYKALVSLVKVKTQSKMFKDVLDLLKCSQFDDTKPYKSKSQLLLSTSDITPQQDDYIYNYIMFVLNTKE